MFGFLKEDYNMKKREVFLLRADQYQQDPSEWFVMPEVDITCLDSGSHPIRLIGSRGSGKTMILRSIAGKALGESIIDESAQATNRLRIYLRPDNQLMGGMIGWGLDKSIWRSASVELILLRIFEEATNKINFWLEERGESRLRLNFQKFCFDDKGEELTNWIRVKQHALYTWARSPDGKPPIVIAALSSLAALIKSLEQSVQGFPKDMSVSVYVDEQETYLEYQQVIINDWIKNPPEGWVFHVAHRRYLKYVKETSTNEIIEALNDFRILDLDEPLVSSTPHAGKNREKFYKKIIINEINELKGVSFDSQDFSPDDLLPSNKSQLADLLREDRYACEAWRRLTEKSSKLVGLDPKATIEKGNSLEDAKWWALWPVLVARKKTKHNAYKENKNLIHNSLNGAVLQIYFESKGRAQMHFYSGFSALCSIVLSNVREFILILQQAIDYERQGDDKKTLTEILDNGISSTSQYKAVMTRSKQFNNVIAISAAERGHDLEQALNNWFLFFSITQRLPTLPYNEPNHITCSDSIDESSPAWETIEAGEKHGAFIFSLSSKQRGNTQVNQRDIRIHPLLAVKHYLSYSKRNTPSLNFDDISRITTASDRKIIETLADKTSPGKDRRNRSGGIQRSLF